MVVRRSRAKASPSQGGDTFGLSKNAYGAMLKRVTAHLASMDVGGAYKNNSVLVSRSVDRSAAYWDAVGHRLPPQLATTLGNYTCVNSVNRFTFNVPATLYGQLMFMYTGTAVRTMFWTNSNLTSVTNFGVYQQSQLSPSNTVPLDIRPLRMSTKIRSVTQNLNIAGDVIACLIPQSLSVTYSSSGQFNAATVASLWNLVQTNPASQVIGNKELSKSHTFVMPPSSFIAYNSYKDWVPIAADGGAQFTGLDMINMYAANGVQVPALTFPFTPTSGTFADIPTNYILLVNVPPNPLAQTFEVETFCQDGVRYPANTMAASVSQSHIPDRPLTDSAVQKSAHEASTVVARASSALNGLHDSGLLFPALEMAGSSVGAMIGARLGNPMMGASYGNRAIKNLERLMIRN